MNKKLVVFLFLILVDTGFVLAQEFRTNAMGGLSYSIYDKDVSFDLYDFGKNPAWLVESEKEMWLDFNPSISNSWGTYRRKYDSEGVYDLRMGVTGVKPLGNSGTFKASAYYDYQFRRNQYRTMKKDPYAGEAFFFTDTTSGNVRFNGPVFSFGHSLGITDNLFLGLTVDYSILAGLKKIYSYAQTIYRDVAATVGMAYKISDNYSIGAKYYYHNTQEKISAEDVNLFSIESFQFRGETYAILYRASSVSHKVKKERNEISAQGYMNPLPELKIGVNASYAEYKTDVLVPKTSVIDAPEGFSSFGEYSFNLEAQYAVSKEMATGLKFGYIKIDNWSKNPMLNLLLWEWNRDALELGAGGSYNFAFADLVVGAEYSIIMNNADSLKYIDDRYNKINSSDHLIKIGFELTPYQNFKLRGGLNYCKMEHDLIYGGSDVGYTYYTLGVGYAYLDFATVNLSVGYLDYNFSNDTTVKRNNFDTKLTLRLFTF